MRKLIGTSLTLISSLVFISLISIAMQVFDKESFFSFLNSVVIFTIIWGPLAILILCGLFFKMKRLGHTLLSIAIVLWAMFISYGYGENKGRNEAHDFSDKFYLAEQERDKAFYKKECNERIEGIKKIVDEEINKAYKQGIKKGSEHVLTQWKQTLNKRQL